MHTVHKTAYGDDVNQALALPPVGIEVSSACENQKCIRWCIRPFRHATPYCPSIGNGRRNRPDDPAPGRDRISTDPPHMSIFVGIVAVPLSRNTPARRSLAPLTGFRPKRRGRVGIAVIAPPWPFIRRGAHRPRERGDPPWPCRIALAPRRRIRRW